MKRIAILLLLAGMVWACNDAGEVSVKSESTEEASHQHETEATSLQLNKGAKWKSDESTTRNVSELEAVTVRFNDLKPTSLEAFQSVGDTLKAGLDTLIRQCRMKGPDHDALHLWLEPLLQHVQQLQTAPDTATASALYQNVNKRIKDYHTYFE